MASHATVVGIPIGVAGASLTLVFTACTGVIKKLLNVTRKKKMKHNKITALANNKLNVIETLFLGALTDFDISHEEFTKIMDEKIKYEDIKENVMSFVETVHETEI